MSYRAQFGQVEFKGSKYSESLRSKDVAALVRAEIKAAVKAGTLPKGKYSVRYKSFAGGTSIDIAVGSLACALYSDAFAAALKGDLRNYEGPTGTARFSPELTSVLKTVEGMLNAYLRDDSVGQVDYFCVNFYGSVDVDWKWEAEVRESLKAAARS